MISEKKMFIIDIDRMCVNYESRNFRKIEAVKQF